MLRMFILLLMLGPAAFAQSAAAPSSLDTFKKEYGALQRDVDDLIESTVPGAELLQTAKATYLDEFGVLVTLEVALERPQNNPFASPRSATEIRLSLTERRKLLQERVQLLLKQKAATLLSVGPAQSIAIVIHLFNPSNLSNVPTQMIFIARKQDPTKVVVREF